MDSTSRPYSQVAQMAGVAPEKAMVACYLLDIARAGRTLDDAAELMRKNRANVRHIARDWGIDFADYSYGDPLVLAWRKTAPGKWALEQAGKVIATANRITKNGYSYFQAVGFDGGHVETGSSAEVACRRLSIIMEEFSVKLFGIDDVEITMPEIGTLAPKAEPLAPKLREALSA